MIKIPCLMFFLSCIPFVILGQKCTPDFDEKDKITKEEQVMFYHQVYETGLGNALINSSEVNITIIIGKFADTVSIGFRIEKQEESAQNAHFESAYKGAKGNQFLLGFKDAKPLNFITANVYSLTKMNNITGKLVTVVILWSPIKKQDVAAVLETLANNQVDAVRGIFENNIVVEKSIKEKHGEKLMKKMVCFKSFLNDKNYFID